MTKRKNIRLTLKPSDAEAFDAAKMKAEHECGYTMRDGEFAARIVLQATRPKKQGQTLDIRVGRDDLTAQSVIDVLNKEIEGGKAE